MMTQEVKESPQWVQTSLAGAMCLGLEPGKFLRDARSTCLNILLTYERGCKAACSYCGLGRSMVNITDQTFIRVKWPTYSMEQILQQLKLEHHPFKRICISMTTNRGCVEDSVTICRQLRENTDIPISVLVSPTVMKGKEDLQKLHDAGADHIGIAVDTATDELFDKHRGKGVNGPHKWEKYWNLVEEAVEVFGPIKTGVHFVVGLGETEKEMVTSIDRAYKMGAMSHMFSFYPEPGSMLQDHPQPPMEQYRRIQLARYLINEGIISGNQISFNDQDEIIEYGVDIQKYLNEGLAFMTSGCPGIDGQVACNRPFANERVNQAMRNYPFVPEKSDIDIIKTQMGDQVQIHG